MNKTLYMAYAKSKTRQYTKEEYLEVLEAMEIRPYLIDKLLGSVHGMRDGKYNQVGQDLVENVVDNLLSSGLINVENVVKIPLTNYKDDN